MRGWNDVVSRPRSGSSQALNTEEERREGERGENKRRQLRTQDNRERKKEEDLGEGSDEEGA